MKVFAVVSLPPPNNGQNIGSKIVSDILFNKFETTIIKTNIDFYLTDNSTFFNRVSYFFLAFFNYVLVFFKVWISFIFINPDVLYFVPSSNKRSIFRDFFIYLPFFCFNKKIICHIRSGDFKLKYFLFRLLYSYKKFHFIFLSNILASNSGVSKLRYSVIPNFIDKNFDFPLERKNMNYKLKLVFLSNLFSSKGIFDVIESVKNSKYSDLLELEIYGSGEKIVINKILNSISEFSFISFKGEIFDREIIRSIFSNSDLFVLPTRYKIEASPRSIIEALSQGCIPLVTNHAGIPDMVDTSCAFIIDKDIDIVSQIECVFNFIFSNPKVLDDMKMAAYNRYNSCFSYKILENKFLACFKL